MTSTEGVDDFLRVEAAASQLLDELTELRRETAGYSEAHAALGATVTSVGELIGKVSETTSGVGEAARSLREIGTPQLIAGQERLLQGQSATASELAAIKAAIDRLQKLMIAGFAVIAVLVIVGVLLSL